MVSSLGSSQLSLARFAFNIYGSMGAEPPRPPRPERPRPGHQLHYTCEREVACLSQLQYPLPALAPADPTLLAPLLHVVIGGKNYLKLLALNAAQTAVVADVNLAETLGRTPHKLFNVNTVKCNGDTVACGLVSGAVHLYAVSPSGRAKLAYKLQDHKRVVNSVDFVEQEQLLVSGSQDGSIKVWDLRLYAPRPVAKLLAASHSDPVRLCETLPHARVRGKLTVLLVHDSGALCKFDLRYPAAAAGAALPERKWTFHSGPALSLHIHPDAEYVLTAGRDRKVCAWNYGEHALHLVTPELVVSTYGPVMKVRWCPLPSDDPSDPDAFDWDDPADRHLSLYSYDFACSYLNDDPTVSVYNLRRKYVPKEIVTTSSGKPLQNFVWARNLLLHRNLWCITKANSFVSYNLADPDLANIARPLLSLPPVATAWSPGYANLAFVSQNSADFDALPDPLAADLDSNDSFGDDPARLDDHHDHLPYGPLLTSGDLHLKGLTPPKDRPPLPRQGTQFTVASIKSLSPGMHLRASASEYMPLPPQRPGLHRNSSQTTQESASHTPGHAPAHKRHAAGSPYVVTLPIPVPLADDTVFDILANEYHISIPDGFSLLDVCQINARVAAMVHRYRDCEVWRMLAVVLEQETQYADPPATNLPENEILPASSDQGFIVADSDAKSVSSYLGNFVGSLNSNSTLTTNYGGPRRINSATSVNKLSILSSSKDSARHFYHLGESLGKELASAPLLAEAGIVSTAGAVDSSSLSKPDPLLSEKQPSEGIASSVESTAPLSKKHSFLTTGSITLKAIDIKQNQNLHPFVSTSPGILMSGESPMKRTVRSSPVPNSSPSRQPWLIPGNSTDLDDENLAPGTAASYSSSGPLGGTDRYSSLGNSLHSGPRIRPSFLSYRSSLTSGRSYLGSSRPGFHMPPTILASPSLEKVDEFSVTSAEPKSSELTKAIKQNNHVFKNADELTNKPWSLINMLAKAVAYANEQGDLIMCSTLILLFHDLFEKNFSSKVLSDQGCLECLGLYIETLRKKCLFTNAVNVVKEAPSSFKYKLSAFASKEVDMRYYCCWCEKLLVNETSKEKFGPASEKFGYWYCDSCSRQQLCCIYCNEPSRGLSVVVGLNCGHRGHFGCLQEWFVDEGNTECPAGCEYATD